MGPEEQIQLLKALIEQQTKYIETQEERIAEKDAIIKELSILADGLRTTVANLEETIDELKRLIYGVKSEKAKAVDGPDDSAVPGTEPETVQVKAHTRKRKPKAKRDDIYSGLPVREVRMPLKDGQRICAYCGTAMDTIGYREVREEIRVTPAKVERVKYLQEVAMCPACKAKDVDGASFERAEVPPALMAHSPASASAVAYIICCKIFLSLPYYRLESAMQQLGFSLPRETMANWFIYCAEHYFKPIYGRMHELLLEREVIHADETYCQVLHEKDRPAQSRSYMWIYLTGSDSLPPIVMYDYQPTRQGIHPKAFLKGFSGLLECDGYQGYNAVEDVVLVCCLAHARRKFFEAVPKARKKGMKLLDINSEGVIKEPLLPEAPDIPNMVPAEIGVAYCNKLFYIERELKGLTADVRKAERLRRETPVWNMFWDWLDTVHPVSGSNLEKAVNYAYNHKGTLRNYMLDGRCEISNNAAERRAKSYAISRKNSLFHTSERGAAASAVMHSIVETAKANNLNIFQYIYIVLIYMPDYINEPAGIDMLLPWSDFIREHCSGLIDVVTITSENHDPLPLQA